jgi:hypothetical protein
VLFIIITEVEHREGVLGSPEVLLVVQLMMVVMCIMGVLYMRIQKLVEYAVIVKDEGVTIVLSFW